MKKIQIFSFSCIFLLALSLNAGTTRTVDDSGGADFLTIQAAIDGAQAGDIIIVAAGTYYENINIDKSLIVVSEDGAEVTFIDAQLADMGVLINGAETVATFDGFTVENYEVVGILAGAFSLTWGDDPIVVHILNNIVNAPSPLVDAHNNNIQVGDGTTGTIIGNEVMGANLVSLDWTGSGILVAGSSNVLISNNFVHDCESGIVIAGYAVNRDAPAEDNLVENNRVEDNGTGISVQMNSIRTIIIGNTVLNNEWGIGSAGNISWEPTIPSGTEIHYNEIVGNVSYGVESSVWDSTLGGPEQVDALYNWWGDQTGPYHSTQWLYNSSWIGPNPGSGDEVSDYVLYDPWLGKGGFITGGGTISSKAGDYRREPDAAGQANFGFVARYNKGANVPAGHTKFVFSAGGFHFRSSEYDWLIVAGNTAMFKGVGTIDGDSGIYKFRIWAKDADQDTFRIKIWEEVNGEDVVYDNDEEQDITGGNIIVHKKKNK